MSCNNCGTTSGKPGGCKSNGGCASGGCNRLNVHDWLMNLPVGDANSSCKVIEVSFNNGSRKDFYRNATLHHFDKGDYITVEGVNGFDVGEVSLSGELVRLQLKKNGVNEFDPEIKKVMRRSTDRDIEIFKQNKAREQEAVIRSRVISRSLNLQMKLTEVEIQADGKKATFFYTADDRVDFRELIKILAAEFKVKVEMKQIGIRQQAAKVGGIGSCGRELCCSTWLTDFKSVTTTQARYQNLSINQTKLSGQCGRLKCCLNYELDTYLDALQHFPDNAETLEIQNNTATLIKKDIFKNLMWYTLPGSTKQYPLTLKRVKEIKQMNARGEKPESLQAIELAVKEKAESAFVELVGHISLRNLEKTSRRNREKEKQKHGPNKINPVQAKDKKPENGNRNGGAGNNTNKPLQKNTGGRPQQGNRPVKPADKPNMNRPPQRDNRK